MPTTTRKLGPARSGRRNADLLTVVPPPPPAAVYLAVKDIKIGPHTLPQGCEVPGASSWKRLDAWVGQRRLRAAAPGEEYLSYEDFLATTQPVLEGTVVDVEPPP